MGRAAAPAGTSALIGAAAAASAIAAPLAAGALAALPQVAGDKVRALEAVAAPTSRPLWSRAETCACHAVY
eukprot:2588151-Pleurochrysis_carterae.AAC.1